MKAEIQRIGPGEEKDYYNVTIEGEQMGVFKLSGKTKEWRYSASGGSKSKHQLRAIEEALFHVDAGFPEVAEGDKTHHVVKAYEVEPVVREKPARARDFINKPVKGY